MNQFSKAELHRQHLSRPHINQLGQLPLLYPRLIESFLLDPAGRLPELLGSRGDVFVMNGGSLLEHPGGNLLVLLMYLVLLPPPLLMHGESVPLLALLGLPLLRSDDLL